MIRAYQPSDLNQLYEICLLTGASGADASSMVTDRKLFGHVFAAQYGILEPEHAFVIDTGDGVAQGYVLGALDTDAFEKRCDEKYRPGLQSTYPQDSGETDVDKMLVGLINGPPHKSTSITREYPSHLHIDLLPQVQGSGNGRQMMETCMHALKADGSPGLHLGVSAQNKRALGFYDHLGFEELHVNSMVHVLGVKF